MSGMEIERKFLVRGDDFKRRAHKSYRIKQGYISSGNGRTVRVRIRDNQGFLTIKGSIHFHIILLKRKLKSLNY